MGIDGLSMANLGLHKEVTSAQMANQAEQLAGKGLEFKIKDIGELSKEKGVERKEDGSSQGGGSFEENLKEDEQNDFKEKFDEKRFKTEDAKEFSVRINPKTEMVELFNNKESKIIETISASDLMQLISKLDSASGIIVNRKI